MGLIVWKHRNAIYVRILQVLGPYVCCDAMCGEYLLSFCIEYHLELSPSVPKE